MKPKNMKVRIKTTKILQKFPFLPMLKKESLDKKSSESFNCYFMLLL